MSEIQGWSERFWSKVDRSGPETGCWEWMGRKNDRGYGLFQVNHKALRASRIAYALHNKTDPDRWCVCHRCDNPGCVNPSHLFLGTRIDNNKDRDQKKRQRATRGEKSNLAKLTDQRVLDIKSLLSQGIKQSEIALKHGVTRGAIWRIAHGYNWKEQPNA